MIEKINSVSKNVKNMIAQQLYKNEKDIRKNNLECGDGISFSKI
jgi:hypothetical protein